jgi:hypothetical protein
MDKLIIPPVPCLCKKPTILRRDPMFGSPIVHECTNCGAYSIVLGSDLDNEE